MSKKKIQTCCLVIDASIAQPAGSLESRHPTGTRCRDFLITVRAVCHRMAWSDAIKAEWDRHQSNFAMQWRVSMMNLKKLRLVQDEQIEELRKAIEDHSEDENVAAVMLKDVHLIEAALATDLRVASMDDNAREHFRRLAAKLDSLHGILWINPAIEEEKVIQWLEKGARADRSRKLKP